MLYHDQINECVMGTGYPGALVQAVADEVTSGSFAQGHIAMVVGLMERRWVSKAFHTAAGCVSGFVAECASFLTS